MKPRSFTGVMSAVPPFAAAALFMASTPSRLSQDTASSTSLAVVGGMGRFVNVPHLACVCSMTVIASLHTRDAVVSSENCGLKVKPFLERLKRFTRIGFRKPGGTSSIHLLCGSFQLTRGVLHPLLNALPPVLHVKGRGGGRSVEWLDLTLRFLKAEIAQLGLGSETVVSRLTDLIFIQAVRAWLAEEPEGAGDRLGALRDRHVGAALRLMHREPGRAWRVSALARAVGVSRATLARRFTLLVGEAPLTYKHIDR
jgi:hypothetical protein